MGRASHGQAEKTVLTRGGRDGRILLTGEQRLATSDLYGRMEQPRLGTVGERGDHGLLRLALGVEGECVGEIIDRVGVGVGVAEVGELLKVAIEVDAIRIDRVAREVHPGDGREGAEVAHLHAYLLRRKLPIGDAREESLVGERGVAGGLARGVGAVAIADEVHGGGGVHLPRVVGRDGAEAVGHLAIVEGLTRLVVRIVGDGGDLPVGRIESGKTEVTVVVVG